ncbi:MAG: MAPEG family protein [Pseudomonadota bacterium]
MITPLYVALFALLLVYLSIQTIRSRRRARIAVGPGEDTQLLRAMRVQANFCEYIPMAIIGMFFGENLWGAGIWIHAMGSSLLLARVSHAYGVAQVQENLRFRQFGMLITFTVIASSAFAILAHYLLVE